MGNRQRGDYLEHQTRDALTHIGFLVIRAGGSRGPADLVALRWGERPLLVQCKVNAARFTRENRRDLRTVANAAGARALVATRVTRGHVDLYAIHPDTGALIHVDTLKVPARTRLTEAVTR